MWLHLTADVDAEFRALREEREARYIELVARVGRREFSVVAEAAREAGRYYRQRNAQLRSVKDAPCPTCKGPVSRTRGRGRHRRIYCGPKCARGVARHIKR